MTDTPDTADPATKKATAEAGLVKAQADARKAVADAGTSELAAQLAQAKALIGETSASGVTGAVTAGDGAALAEANVQARACFAQIATALKALVATITPGTNVFLTSASTAPSIGAAQSYKFQQALVTTTVDAAMTLSDQCLATDAAAANPTAATKLVGPIAIAGLVLSGAANLLSFFKTDVTLAGRDLKLTDRPLLAVIAAMLIAEKKVVRIDGVVPALAPDDDAELMTQVRELTKQVGDARLRAAEHASIIKQLTPVAAPPGTSVPDPDKTGRKPRHDAAAGALNAAIAQAQSFLDGLLAVSDGVCALQRVAEGRALKTFLEDANASILIVQLDGAFASSVSTRNLWSNFKPDSMPYRVSAVVNASWWSIDGKTRQLRGSGLASGREKFAALTAI